MSINDKKVEIRQFNSTSGIYDTALYPKTSAANTLYGDNGSTLAGVINTINGNMATVEDGATSSKSYKIGDLLIYNGHVQKVIVPISAGETIIPNVNIQVTELDDELRTGGIIYLTKSQYDALVASGQVDPNRLYCVTTTTVTIGYPYLKTQMDTLLAGKQDTLTFDSTPTSGSSNPVTSDGLYNSMGEGTDVVVFDGVYTSKSAGGLERSIPTVLSAARAFLAGASVGDYALFGGGNPGSSSLAVVDAYNLSLTRSTPTELSTARDMFAGASVGDYALFGGGAGSTVVDAYNLSLTHSTTTGLNVTRYGLAGASNGDYALFGGGNRSSKSLAATVDAYNSSLTRSILPELSTARAALAGASVGDYALFGGGNAEDSVPVSVVDAYNLSLTHSTPTALSTFRGNLVGTSVGDYALFGGGAPSTGVSAVVEAYNLSLTRSTPTALSVARSAPAGTSVSNYALFGGGLPSARYSAVVDAYNLSLTRSVPTALSQARCFLAGASVGNYALFGGGKSDTYFNIVDAYTESYTYHLTTTIPPYSKYSITGVTTEETLTLTEVNIDATANTPFNGYVKLGFTLSGQMP